MLRLLPGSQGSQENAAIHCGTLNEARAHLNAFTEVHDVDMTAVHALWKSNQDRWCVGTAGGEAEDMAG